MNRTLYTLIDMYVSALNVNKRGQCVILRRLTSLLFLLLAMLVAGCIRTPADPEKVAQEVGQALGLATLYAQRCGITAYSEQYVSILIKITVINLEEPSFNHNREMAMVAGYRAGGPLDSCSMEVIVEVDNLLVYAEDKLDDLIERNSISLPSEREMRQAFHDGLRILNWPDGIMPQ